MEEGCVGWRDEDLTLKIKQLYINTSTVEKWTLKDPCSEFSKVGILHVQPVEGHFWSPRSPGG